VQTLLSLHSLSTLQQPAIGVFVQAPPGPEQVSVVHALRSLQSAFVLQQFGTGVVPQPPGSEQLPMTHGLPVVQLSGVPAVQRPVWQVSLPLQTIPSGQGVLFG
jgi:hypothetical protein